MTNVWVFAQEAAGAPTTGTLELLTKARSLGTVTAFVGGDASAIAGALGEYGATTVYATGDLGGKLPGVAVSAAMKAVIDGGDSPDVILFPQNYEGRDVLSRLLMGGRLSLMMGLSATLVSLAVGVPVGLAAGYFRGWIDEVLMRCADVLMAVPPIMLGLLVLGLLLLRVLLLRVPLEPDRSLGALSLLEMKPISNLFYSKL
jgi:ABC-type dipeptide/oligopeptide/nickel transport system permease subunit